MISKKKIIELVIPFLIVIGTLTISLILQLKFEDNKELVLDKAIDVCSIFFGIFIGALFLFERLKNKSTLADLKKFSYYLLIGNLFIIFFSFIIINYNESLNYAFNLKSYNVELQSIIYSVYLTLFNLCIYYIFRFIKMIILLV